MRVCCCVSNDLPSFFVSPLTTSSKLDSTFELRERSQKYRNCIYVLEFEALREQLLNKENLKKNTSRVNFSDVDSSGGSSRCDCSLAAQVGGGGGGATVVCSGQFTWQQDPPTWRGWSHGNPGKLGCQIGQPLKRGV